jgi:hypothetical protein
LIIALISIFGPSATAEAQQNLQSFELFDFATADTYGQYTMLRLKWLDKDHVETLVRRTSLRSGELTFTKRIVEATCGSNPWQALMIWQNSIRPSPIHGV